MSKTKLTIAAQPVHPPYSCVLVSIQCYFHQVLSMPHLKSYLDLLLLFLLLTSSNNLIKQNKDKNNYYKLFTILLHLHTLIFTPREFVSL